MAHNVTVSGVAGFLRNGYFLAGTLGPWTVTRSESAWTLTAAILKTDAFRVSQRPLRFVATHAKGAWVWPIVELHISGASLNAVLGPLEK